MSTDCSVPRWKKLLSRIKRKWSYLFIRRLASNQIVGRDLYLYEWQKMPKGYRWY